MLKIEYIGRNILSFLTIIAGIILFFYGAFTGGLTVFQGCVLSAVILFCITVVIEHKSSFNGIENCLKKILNTLPQDSITAFKSFEECVDEIERIYKKTESSIYTASLDYKYRGDDPKGRSKMNNLKDQFATDKKIKYRYLAYPSVAKLEGVLKNIVKGNTREKKSYYAFVNEEICLPFASFMIFDKKHVVVRGPYEGGKDEPYTLVSNQLLCNMFYNWHDMIWKEAEKTDDKDRLERLIEIAKIREKKVSCAES
ncbi:MAG: hypothetical protein LBU70_07205 [Chitinispirillales bacterium]|jgi:hypothetical protein|nr:hypothetical protein [Chitinispirillales bacterium]